MGTRLRGRLGKNHGGRRRGSGRKAGLPPRRRRAELLQAMADGKLPHQLLCEWAQTGIMDGKRIPRSMRLEAAKAAAPYYAPKLATTVVTGKDGGPIEHRHQARELIEQRIAAIAERIGEDRPAGATLN